MALPDLKRSLIRTATVPIVPGTRVTFYAYATASAVATVKTAGHFNFARDVLKVDDVITAQCVVGGTADLVILKVTAVPASGNVTVADAMVTHLT